VRERKRVTPDEIEKLIRIATVPEEDWSAADAEYVLRLYGIDPADSSKDACELILRMIDSARDKGEEVPPEYMNILWDLTSNEEREKEKELVANARREMQEMEQMPFPPHLTAARVAQHFREKGKLSEADKKILKDLERELFQEAHKSLDSK
jgi:hypothetical protein